MKIDNSNLMNYTTTTGSKQQTIFNLEELLMLTDDYSQLAFNHFN